MSSSKKSDLLILLKTAYPEVIFKAGEDFSWHPDERTVYYIDSQIGAISGNLQLLHETAHACLEHQDYDFDSELIRIELEAWRKCRELSIKYDQPVESRYIEDCLDSYRDWLHKRSTCIDCGQVSLETGPFLYKCFNCQASWRVPASPLCRRVTV